MPGYIFRFRFQQKYERLITQIRSNRRYLTIITIFTYLAILINYEGKQVNKLQCNLKLLNLGKLELNIAVWYGKGIGTLNEHI